ncbi:MAG: LytTR family DNA-binding domain-containing protein, partial [Saprospiraceae bacterium]
MNCLLVEDEPLAALVLEDYIGQVPWLHFVGRCPDAVQALEAMQQQAVEVLLLDIHLPGLKGLDFLRSLLHPPQTILTTAYQEYALDGYDLGVVDYLLKPIDFDRFLKAIQKIRHPEPPKMSLPRPRTFHFFNCNKKMVRVWLDEIAVVESLKEYVRLHLHDGTSLVTKSQLGNMETLLQAFHFLQPHRSFLVALPHVTAFTATEI